MRFIIQENPMETGERFRVLAQRWKEESQSMSNTTQMAMLRSYQGIVGIGPSVVPMILEEMAREPNHWFWALEAITQENPVPAEVAGRVESMAQAWLAWG
jgi:hypothetical protein